MHALLKEIRAWKYALALFICVALFVLFTLNWNRNSPQSFVITFVEDNSALYAGTLQYDYHFTTQSIPLILTAEQKKELRIRITHKDDAVDYAHIDLLALQVGNSEVPPDEVTIAETKESIVYKVSKLDNDVIDVTGQTIEAVWRNSNAEEVLLMLNAREEVLKTLPGVPFKVPQNLDLNNKETFIEYQLKNDGSIIVDGKITAADKLGKPDRAEYMVAVSGHPPGFTYFYIKNDREYLYVTEDFTPDNTLDKEDWAAVYVFTPTGLKTFNRNEYGTSGYVYTDTVAYQHIVNEFKIPLSAIDAKSNDMIAISFELYGTAAADGGTGQGADQGGTEGGSTSGTAGMADTGAGMTGATNADPGTGPGTSSLGGMADTGAGMTGATNADPGPGPGPGAPSAPGDPSPDSRDSTQANDGPSGNVGGEGPAQAVITAARVTQSASTLVGQVANIVAVNPIVNNAAVSTTTQVNSELLESIIVSVNKLKQTSAVYTSLGAATLEAEPAKVIELARVVEATVYSLARDVLGKNYEIIEGKTPALSAAVGDVSPNVFGIFKQTLNALAKPFSEEARNRKFAGYTGRYTVEYVLDVIYKGIDTLKNIKPVVKTTPASSGAKPKSIADLILVRFKNIIEQYPSNAQKGIEAPRSTQPAVAKTVISASEQKSKNIADIVSQRFTNTTEPRSLNVETVRETSSEIAPVRKIIPPPVVFGALPPTVEIHASSDFNGRTSVLSWKSTHATTCVGENFETSGAISGSVTVTQTADTKYSVICTGPRGSRGAVATVDVLEDADVPKNPTISIKQVRGEAIISWSSPTEKCTISGSNGFSFTTSSKTGSTNAGPVKSGTNYTSSCEVGR